MSIILPNLKDSFICSVPVSVSVPVPVPVPVLEFQIRIFLFSIGHYRNVRGLGKSMVVFRLFEKLRYSNERSPIF